MQLSREDIREYWTSGGGTIQLLAGHKKEELSDGSDVVHERREESRKTSSLVVLTNWKDKIAVHKGGQNCGESNLELETRSSFDFGHIKIEVSFRHPS